MRKILMLVLLLVVMASCGGMEPTEVETLEQEPKQEDAEDLIILDPSSPSGGVTVDLSTLAVLNPENLNRLKELKVLEGHTDSIVWIDISPDGKNLASSGMDGLVRLWDISSGGEYASVKHGFEALGTAYSPDGIHLASGGSDRIVRVWNVKTGEQVHALEGHATGITDVACSPDGKVVASASRDATIHIWDIVTGEELLVFRGHEDDIYGIAYHPGGSMLASASLDGTARIWDVETGEEMQLLTDHEEDVYSVAFSSDGTQLATCGGGLMDKDHSVRIWDTSSWEVTTLLDEYTKTVVGCEFSNDDSLLVTRVQGGEVFIWDLQAMEIVKTMQVPGWWLYSIALDPEGKLLAVGDVNGGIHLYGVPE